MQLRNIPSHIAEDDRLRSCHIRELVQENTPIEGSVPVHIPKVIIQFWHDLACVPADVRECLCSWESLTTCGFKRILFGDDEASDFIGTQFGRRYVAAFRRCGHPAMRCDYFRLCYIYRLGGFYVDADEFYQGGDCLSLYRDNRLKIQPLCYDNQTTLMVPTELFTQQMSYSVDWTFYVNNNPLIAPPCHPVVHLALARATRILLSHKDTLFDIQSTTGPGNLTASLVRHSLICRAESRDLDVCFLTNWAAISTSRWPLSYRGDERNWRLWNQKV
jgi:mannosyltransferase OCH1-like enzyme